MCNVNVSRTGLLALVPHAPSLATQLKAVAALGVVVEGYKATGKAEAIRASGQTSHSVAKILSHRRQAGANAVEFLVGWASGEETWEPEHLLGGANSYVQSFLRSAAPLPYNGVFVGDWLSFKFGVSKPAGFLQFNQLCGKGNAMMELGLSQIEQFDTQQHNWLDVNALCYALRQLLAQAGPVADRFALFDPNAWSSFSHCTATDKHHMLTNCPDFLQREWWLLPACWAGGHLLTDASGLGFAAGGVHWTIAIVHKPPNAPARIVHYDPAGCNGAPATAMDVHLLQLAGFLRACCGTKQAQQAKLLASPRQAGGWECGYYVALLAQQLLESVHNNMPLDKMAFSFGLQELDCLKRCLLAGALAQSTNRLKALCAVGRATGTACAFVVAELKVVAGEDWCRVVAGARSFWCGVHLASGDFKQLPAPVAV
jgi:hypothetical protein